MGAEWLYDSQENILFASHPTPTELSTKEQMRAYFDDGIAFWREHCNGQKVYIVVNYANLSTNLDELEFYAQQVKRVVKTCAITIVRYNGSLLQRMAGRMTAIKLHTPSNTYASRDEALDVVQGLKQGTISLHVPPSR